MQTKKLNISECHSQCPKCKIETDFLMFESGCGGDFETFIGDTSGTIYRMDMHKLHYMHLEAKDLLEPAIKAEGGADKVRNIPDQVKCNVCKAIFKAVPISVSGERKVNAIEL